MEDWSTSSMSESSLYKIDGKSFCINTKDNFVKMFDFDRSSFYCDRTKINSKYHWLIEEYEKELQALNIVTTKCENPYTNANSYLCKTYGQCNEPNSKYDAYLTLSFIRKELEGKKAKRGDLKTVYDWIYAITRPAFRETASNDRIHLISTPADKVFPTVGELLNSDFFDDLKCKESLDLNSIPLKQQYAAPLLV